MREPNEVDPEPRTVEGVLRLGLEEIAAMSTGNHQSDPGYEARREVKDYAKRILAAAANREIS